LNRSKKQRRGAHEFFKAHVPFRGVWTSLYLPTSRLHDFGQGRAPGTLHHGDDLGFLVCAIGLRFAGRLLGPPAFFAGLDFLQGWRLPLGCAAGADLLVFSLSIAFSLMKFLLDRVAVVT
jgi:hypothetical protein